MSEFSNNIEKLIGQNRVEVAIEEFQKLLNEFKPDSDSGHAEARELKTFFIGLSQRLYQAKDNLKTGNITDQDLSRERQKISNQLLETVFDLDKNREFNSFINTKEEEFAWENAKSLNTIAGYEEYFRNFPNQKYVKEPPRFLEELKNELRQKAEAERRRTQNESKPVQNTTASTSTYQSEPTTPKKSNSRMMMIIGAVVVVVIIIIIALNSGKKSDISGSDATFYDSTAAEGSVDNSEAAADQNNSNATASDQNESPSGTPQHCSLNSNQPVDVSFVNESGLTLDVYWIGYDCKGVAFGTLKNGEDLPEKTYATHVWDFVDPKTGTIHLEYVIARGDSILTIQ